MGKEKVTSETLMDKCTNYGCDYNESGFCHLPSIMLGDDSRCIYASNKEDDKNEKTVG